MFLASVERPPGRSATRLVVYPELHLQGADRPAAERTDGLGRVGLSICYDAWFPELTRHLAWMGAEVVVNVVKTTTVDRAHELVLAAANAIVNQVFVISVNAVLRSVSGRAWWSTPRGWSVRPRRVSLPPC
ncbi:MAG TPA: nitrilase-related carbon-nitrogen hydrolase [Pseudonocardia sp.]